MLQISNMILSSLVLLLLQILTTLGELIKDPTLKPIDPFSASGDAVIFKKEMKEDATTNRDKLVCIWFHRTYDQRKQINDFYNGNFCPVTWSGYYYSYRCPFWWGLIEISRHSMQKLYDLSLSSPSEILGETVYQALTGKWKEAGALEEILCANDPEMKKNITDYYQEVYKDTVENHLATFKKDDKEFQHVMQQYCRKGLCQDKKIKPEDVDKEAQALRFINPDSDKEGFKKKLNELLDKYCEPDMKMIFEKYRQDKNGIAEAVEKAFCNSKEAEKVYYRLVRYIENTCQFYANELHHAIDGIGTDIDKINRIILTRCERDLKCILDKYKETYGKTFTNDLKWDTSEDRYLTSIRYLCGKTYKEKFKNKLIDLLDKNCEPDLKMIFEKYRQDKNGISDAVDKAFEVKRVRRAYNHLVRYIESTCKYYSDELNEAVDGCGTDIDKINRIVLTRCERDLGCVLKKYQESYNKSFIKRLVTDTLGEPFYRASLRHLCGD